jgi:hypothetical protein
MSAFGQMQTFMTAQTWRARPASDRKRDTQRTSRRYSQQPDGHHRGDLAKYLLPEATPWNKGAVVWFAGCPQASECGRPSAFRWAKYPTGEER